MTTSAADAPGVPPALSIRGLSKHFGTKTAVAGIDLDVPAGSFYGLVGPNGAGKTTSLSMATGLLRPDAGQVWVHGVDVWRNQLQAKRLMGLLPDGVRLFDRLTGEQLVSYAGLLRGMDKDTVAARVKDLLLALDLVKDAGTLVVDYSAGMTKKIALAAALIHAPRLLVLDEPFESVDPVSAANIRDILHDYVDSGGTVIVSSHVMDLVQRMCDHVAVISGGRVLAAGTVDEVRGEQSLEDRFVELVGGRNQTAGLQWLRTS
ncbi:ABC transporter ATP-binding protein [Specibacter sp. NPDC057265]|uniref:ABC transporter ATP-binding protein n=1 Tax=Specibacter sp. NPDC057265 TaxID=3346075 RepID=UPI00363EDE8F